MKSSEHGGKENAEGCGGQRRYHHGDLRQALICAASEHMKREGLDSLSLRALAREAGVSQTAPYRHFRTKNCLIAALAEQGFREMLRDVSAAAELYRRTDVRRALVEAGLAYLGYARTNPEKYRLIFDSSHMSYEDYPALDEVARACFDILVGLIRQAQREEVVVERPVEQLAMVIWSQIHGMSSLLISKGHLAAQGADERVGPLKALHSAVANPRRIIEITLGSILRH